MAGTPQTVTITSIVPGNAWVSARISTQIQLYFDVPTASGRIDSKYEPQ